MKTFSSSDEDTRHLIAVRDDRSPEAFSHLYLRFASRLHSFIRAKHAQRLDADEIVQDIFLTVWQRASSFDASKASATTWIFSIARHKWIDAVRRPVRAHVVLDAARWVEDGRPGVEVVVMARQRAAKIEEALRGLPMPVRRLIQLTFFDGLSYRGAAAALGIPEGTVKSRLRLVFTKLKIDLARDAADDGS